MHLSLVQAGDGGLAFHYVKFKEQTHGSPTPPPLPGV